MKYKKLYILVEGVKDEKFINGVIKPIFEKKYSSVKVIKCATLGNTKIYNLLRGIKSMRADYFYVRDINKAPCVTKIKQKTQSRFRNIDTCRVIVVVKEIESWYLAGLSGRCAKIFNIRPFGTTNDITKEKFNDLSPKKFDSKIDFMSEILKYFSIWVAIRKNKSFRYFVENHDCPVSIGVGSDR